MNQIVLLVEMRSHLRCVPYRFIACVVVDTYFLEHYPLTHLKGGASSETQ